MKFVLQPWQLFLLILASWVVSTVAFLSELPPIDDPNRLRHLLKRRVNGRTKTSGGRIVSQVLTRQSFLLGPSATVRSRA